MILSMNEMAWLVLNSSWPSAHHKTVIAVGMAESKGDTDAIGVNPSTVSTAPDNVDGYTPLSASEDLGWLQVNNYWHQEKARKAGLNWRNPADEVEWAWLAWNEGKTWDKWTTYKKGLHRPFLPGAATALRAPSAPPASLFFPVATLQDLERLAAANEMRVKSMAASVGQIARHFAL
jgi:hypothetical protein